MIQFCRYCGNRLPADAVFCNSCGHKVGNAGQDEAQRSSPASSAPLTPPGIQPTVQSLPPYQPVAPISSPFYPGWPVQSGQSGSGFYEEESTFQATPPTRLQRLLVRIFQPAMANNAFFGIMLGAVLALILGGALSGLLDLMAHVFAPHPLNPSEIPGPDLVFYALGFIPLHTPFRDIMEIFFFAQGAAGATQFTEGSFTSSFTFNATLSGLLIIPALVLTLAGYIAAAVQQLLCRMLC
jgi:hypothetical protein